jgi:hypothetical protein
MYQFYKLPSKEDADTGTRLEKRFLQGYFKPEKSLKVLAILKNF